MRKEGRIYILRMGKEGKIDILRMIDKEIQRMWREKCQELRMGKTDIERMKLGIESDIQIKILKPTHK